MNKKKSDFCNLMIQKEKKKKEKKMRDSQTYKSTPCTIPSFKTSNFITKKKKQRTDPIEITSYTIYVI